MPGLCPVSAASAFSVPAGTTADTPARNLGPDPQHPGLGLGSCDLPRSEPLCSSGERRTHGKQQGNSESNFGSSPGPRLGWCGCGSVGTLEDKPDNLRVRQSGPRGCRSLGVVLFLHLPPCAQESRGTLWGGGWSSTVRDAGQLPGGNRGMAAGSAGLHVYSRHAVACAWVGQAAPRHPSAFL